MGHLLENFADYSPSMWVSQGVFFNQVAEAAKDVAKAVVRGAAAVAAAGVVAVSSSVVMPAENSAAWPPSVQEQERDQVQANVHALFAQIDSKLARFNQSTGSALNPELLREARLTVASIAGKKQG